MFFYKQQKKLEFDMFKKPVKVSAQNQLSGKDRKTMKNKLSESFDEGCVDKILNLNDKIISCKISGSKMLIYNGNDYPLFVDGTGKNDYFPSLYAVMAYQTLLKFVDINEGVESYIFNGANLMWPGVRDFRGLDNFQKDQVVGIRSAKGEPIAVGAMGCSLKELQGNKDNSGVAVYILHYFNDKLWESGPKTFPQVIIAAPKPKQEVEKVEQPKEEPKKKEQEEPVKKEEQKGKGKKKVEQEEVKQEKAKDKKKDKKRQQSSQEKPKDKKKEKKKEQSEDEKPKDKKKAQRKEESEDEKPKDKKKDKKKDEEQEEKPKDKKKDKKKQESEDEKPKDKKKDKKKEEEQEEKPKDKKKNKKRDESSQEKPKDKKKNKKQESEDEKPKDKKKDNKKKQESEDERPKDKKKDKKKQESEDQKPKDKKKDKKKKQSSEEKAKEKSEKEDSSDDEADFSNLLNVRQPKATHAQVQKIQKKGPAPKVFSDDEENDKKAKKKTNKKQTKKGTKKDEKKSDNESQNSQGEKEGHQEQKSVVSSKLMDQQFKEAFLNALKLSKVEGELPIDSGRFFMDFMLLARPPGVKLEIKDTSYKKLGKFYEEMGKQKLIEFKHNKDKKGQQGSTIAKIMWDNEQLKNYEPTILRMNQKDIEEKEEVGQSKKKLKLSTSLQVQTAYKLHQNFKSALYTRKINYAPTQQQQKQIKKEQEQIRNLPEFYSQQQVRALIEKYINDKLMPKKNKDQKDKDKKIQKIVSIDYKSNQYLADLLKKEIQEFQENVEAEKDVQSGEDDEPKKPKKKRQNILRMDRGALVNRILKTCSTSYHMRDKQTNFQAFMEGTFKGIQLTAEKSNNKNITKIIGLETFIVPKNEADQQINWLANTLKQKFACSVNVLNLPGRNAGKEIIVHGNFINELEDMLTQEYKINEDYITSQNKLDKKKKR